MAEITSDVLDLAQGPPLWLVIVVMVVGLTAFVLPSVIRRIRRHHAPSLTHASGMRKTLGSKPVCIEQEDCRLHDSQTLVPHCIVREREDWFVVDYSGTLKLGSSFLDSKTRLNDRDRLCYCGEEYWFRARRRRVECRCSAGSLTLKRMVGTGANFKTHLAFEDQEMRAVQFLAPDPQGYGTPLNDLGPKDWLSTCTTYCQHFHSEHLVKVYPNAKYAASDSILVMELCTLGSLKDLVRANVRLSETVATRLLSEVVTGLAYLHIEERCVHGNLVTSNLLLTRDSVGIPRVKIGGLVACSMYCHRLATMEERISRETIHEKASAPPAGHSKSTREAKPADDDKAVDKNPVANRPNPPLKLILKDYTDLAAVAYELLTGREPFGDLFSDIQFPKWRRETGPSILLDFAGEVAVTPELDEVLKILMAGNSSDEARNEAKEGLCRIMALAEGGSTA